MKSNDVKRIGENLIELAELLTDGDTDYIITADELLENITGRSISEECAGEIKIYLNWNHWCRTGEILFEHASKRDDGRW